MIARSFKRAQNDPETTGRPDSLCANSIDAESASVHCVHRRVRGFETSQRSRPFCPAAHSIDARAQGRAPRDEPFRTARRLQGGDGDACVGKQACAPKRIHMYMRQKKRKKKKNERRLQMTVPLYIIVCHTQSRRGREPPRIPKSCLQTCRADCFISMRNPFAKTRMTMTEATTRRQRTPSTRSSSRCFPFRENRFTQSIRFCCRHTNRINHLWTL